MGRRRKTSHRRNGLTRRALLTGALRAAAVTLNDTRASAQALPLAGLSRRSGPAGSVSQRRSSLSAGAAPNMDQALGDDTGIHDSFSVDIELMELVSAGMTPSQAIFAAR